MPKFFLIIFLTICLAASPAFAGDAPREDGPSESPETHTDNETGGIHAGHIAGFTTMGVGLSALGVGAGMHVANREATTTSQILYVAGGFVTLVGAYVLIQSYAGHPNPSPPRQALMPYLSPTGSGLVFTGTF